MSQGFVHTEALASEDASDNVKTGFNTKPRVDDHSLDQFEFSEYQHISPSYAFSLDGWTTDMRLFLELDIDLLKNFLLKYPGFEKEDLRRYKLLRRYAHVIAKNVHSVLFNPLDS